MIFQDGEKNKKAGVGMKSMRIMGIVLAVFLALTGCSKPVELEGIYILDEYEGENEAIRAFTESLGYYVEATSDGYSFLPIVLQEGEIIALSEEPWGLLRSEKNRYRIFLYTGDLTAFVKGPDALQEELDQDPYIFNHYLEVRARDDGLQGRIVGAGEKAAVHLAKMETETQ